MVCMPLGFAMSRLQKIPTTRDAYFSHDDVTVEYILPYTVTVAPVSENCKALLRIDAVG